MCFWPAGASTARTSCCRRRAACRHGRRERPDAVPTSVCPIEFRVAHCAAQLPVAIEPALKLRTQSVNGRTLRDFRALCGILPTGKPSGRVSHGRAGEVLLRWGGPPSPWLILPHALRSPHGNDQPFDPECRAGPLLGWRRSVSTAQPHPVFERDRVPPRLYLPLFCSSRRDLYLSSTMIKTWGYESDSDPPRFSLCLFMSATESWHDAA